MAAPAINPNRKGYSGKPPHEIKKVQWVRVRRAIVGNTPVSDPFKFQEYGIIKVDKEKDDGNEG
jgi:hypothetical protein